MVVRDGTEGGERIHICVPQSQHAALAGQVARAWGNINFPAPEPRHAVCLAAERHDDGMKPFDEAPELDPDTGLPRDFMHMSLERWIECWERGPRTVADDNPYAGLLVSMHGLHLLGYRRKGDSSEADRRLMEEFESDQRSLQEELRDAAAEIDACRPHLDEPTLERNRKLIEVWDAISLALCMPRLPCSFEGVPSDGGSPALEIDEVGTVGRGPVVAEVDPWPFSAENVPLAASGRVLTRTCSSRGELDEALASARVTMLEIELKPRERDRVLGSRTGELPL